jgi:hypothetical protein
MGVFVPPRACLAIVNEGPGTLTLVSAQCPDPGPDLELVEPLLRASEAEQGAPPRTARLWERESHPSGDRWYRVLVDERMGSTQVTQFVGAIPPGRARPLRVRGGAVLPRRRRPAVGRRSVGPGRAGPLRVPAPRRCTARNTGTAELRLLGVFHPSGSPAVSYGSR